MNWARLLDSLSRLGEDYVINIHPSDFSALRRAAALNSALWSEIPPTTIMGHTLHCTTLAPEDTLLVCSKTGRLVARVELEEGGYTLHLS